MSELTHQTVLLQEAVSAVFSRADGVYVDATFGRGGHSRLLLSRLDDQGRLYAFDKDTEAMAEAARIADARFTAIHQGFRHMKAELAARGVTAVTGVLMDLGVSSPQIDDPSRGFSFRHDAPLDMRMDTTRGETAAEWLARATEKEIGEVIWTYGEERFARAIAKAIVARRADGHTITTTRQLAELVAGEVRTREAGQDPATRTFQALRIHVNAELEELQAALTQALDLLEPGGRLCVISFHSLEDRIVKRFLRDESGRTQHEQDALTRHLPIDPVPRRAVRMKLLTKLRPGDEEVRANPRARSAVMRSALKLLELPTA
jgi:16S rRNA (cytosine1402-N4)-methyltransferase